jgi:hypothetical protein
VQPEASSRLINTFFDSDKVDDSLYHPETVDFTPAWTFGDVTNVFIALALAAVTVLPLVCMVWWVHRRSRFGGNASAVLRSAYPIILGAGGWLLGALIVLGRCPASRLTTSCWSPCRSACPSALGIYLAWVHRDLGEPDEGPRARGRSRWSARRRQARVPCDDGFGGVGHRDPRGRRRRQPRPDLARHAAGWVRG